MKILYAHWEQDEFSHPVHKRLAKIIGADEYKYIYELPKSSDFIKILSVLPSIVYSSLNMPDSDVYLCEAQISSILPLILKKIMNNKCKIITIMAGQRLMVQKKLLTRLKVLNIYERMFYLVFWYLARKFIDGGIVISKFLKNACRDLFPIPMKLIYPFVLNEMYSKLVNVQPNLDSNTIVSVGVAHERNGMDILVNAFKLVVKEFPNAKLYIVGKGHPAMWNNINGVNVVGYVKDILPYFRLSSLFCLIGRAQPFSVAVIEAMCAGLPPIVSKYTGSSEIVRKIGDQLISDLNKKDVADRIMWYFSLSKLEKKKLSKRARKIGMSMVEEMIATKIKRSFGDLLSKI